MHLKDRSSIFTRLCTLSQKDYFSAWSVCTELCFMAKTLEPSSAKASRLWQCNNLFTAKASMLVIFMLNYCFVVCSTHPKHNRTVKYYTYCKCVMCTCMAGDLVLHEVVQRCCVWLDIRNFISSTVHFVWQYSLPSENLESIGSQRCSMILQGCHKKDVQWSCRVVTRTYKHK